MNNTEELFYERYTPFLNHFYNDEDGCSWNGEMYETDGEELEYVEMIAKDPVLRKRLWTILESDSDEPESDDNVFIIQAGYHYVNRYGYLITEEPWEDEEEWYTAN